MCYVVIVEFFQSRLAVKVHVQYFFCLFYVCVKVQLLSHAFMCWRMVLMWWWKKGVLIIFYNSCGTLI